MTQIIIGLTLSIIAITLLGTYQAASKPNKNILLGILLPINAQMESAVLEIIKKYRRGNYIIFFLSLLAVLPLFFIKYTSFIILSMSVLCIAYFVANSYHYKKYFMKLLLLKSENKWFLNDYEFHMLTANHEGTERKNSFNVLFHRIKPSWKEQILAKAEQPIYVDEDEYWINGYYYNPDDPKTVVEKRVGIGSTCNMATKSGKVAAYGGILFGLVVMGAVFILFLFMDFATFSMSIEGDTVSINAPYYEEQFEAVDMITITLTEKLPQHGIRTNGAATDLYYLGNFNFEEYGKSKVYLYKDYPPYIIIGLSDRTVLFNTKSEEETREQYKKLLALKERKSK